MKKLPQVLAIILNWKQPQATLECVAALKAMSYPQLEILIIDNGSGEDSKNYLQQNLSDTLTIFLPQNLGFARGCNVGLAFAAKNQFDYALLINNDAFPAPSMLHKLIDKVENDIALLSPKIYYEAEPNRIWFAGGKQHPILLELRDTGRKEFDNPKWQHSKDVDYLLGTCLLVNLDIISSIGFLDERFFMYYEDLDWSIRVRQAGYRLRLVSEAHLYHRVALSTGGLDSPTRRYYLAKSSFLFWRTHAHKGIPAAIIIFRLLSIIKTTFRLLTQGKYQSAKSHLLGLKDGWSAPKNAHILRYNKQ